MEKGKLYGGGRSCICLPGGRCMDNKPLLGMGNWRGSGSGSG